MSLGKVGIAELKIYVHHIYFWVIQLTSFPSLFLPPWSPVYPQIAYLDI